MSLSPSQQAARDKVREGLELQHSRGPFARPWRDKQFLDWLRLEGFEMSRHAFLRHRRAIRCKAIRGDIVYILQAGSFLKIGFTTKTVDARIGELQTGCPYPIRVLAVIRGSQKLESELHRRFAAHRAEGEWFNAHPEILDYVSAHNMSACSAQMRGLDISFHVPA
jgi:hypothetical protein